MITNDASPVASAEAFRNGLAASKALTMPSTSSRKFCSHDVGSAPCAIAPALETSMWIPPSSSPAALIQAFNAAPSMMSTEAPVARTPRLRRLSTVSCTCSALRAQMATFAPSRARLSAIARPIPRVPPRMTALRPLICRSMKRLPFWRRLWRWRASCHRSGAMSRPHDRGLSVYRRRRLV